MRTILLISAIGLLLPIKAQSIFEQLDYGPHPVGFTHYTATDSTRQYQRAYDFNDSTIYRPIPISVWYPARKQTDGQKLSVQDYLRIVAEEAEWENLPDDLLLGWFGYGTDSIYQSRLGLETEAIRDIPYDGGDHALIIYSPGYERSSVENFALCEFLASRGYVVISSPSRGNNTVFLDNASFRDIETQTRDFEFLVQEARSRYAAGRPVDVAALGYSFGGLAGVYTATRNDYVNAVISLDGAIKYQYEKLKQSPYFDAGDFKVAMVHFSQKDIPEVMLKAEGLPASINTDFDFFDELSGVHAYKLRMDSLSHSYFTSLGVLLRPTDSRQDPEWAEINSSYQTLCQLTLKALNAFLNSSNSFKKLAFAEEVNGQVGCKLLDYKTLNANRALNASMFEKWNVFMRSIDYRNIGMRHSSSNKNLDAACLPTYHPEEWKLNTLALKLAFDPKTYEAGIRVGEFATTIYPESANLYDTLGEIYLLGERKEKAKLSFQKSLELYPGNENAVKRLRELEDD